MSEQTIEFPEIRQPNEPYLVALEEFAVAMADRGRLGGDLFWVDDYYIDGARVFWGVDEDDAARRSYAHARSHVVMAEREQLRACRERSAAWWAARRAGR